MSPQQKYLIRKSFSRIEGMGTVPALIFYRRLFEMAPELRSLFKSDIEAQASRLLEMLALLISHLENGTLLAMELQQLGQRHTGYGVKPEHFEIVGRALIQMLRETVGGEFTAEVEEAWIDLYRAVAESMIAGG